MTPQSYDATVVVGEDERGEEVGIGVQVHEGTTTVYLEPALNDSDDFDELSSSMAAELAEHLTRAAAVARHNAHIHDTHPRGEGG